MRRKNLKFLVFLSTLSLVFGLWVSLANNEEDWPEPPFGPESIAVISDLSPDKAEGLLAELKDIYSQGEALYEELESGRLSEEEERRVLEAIRSKVRRYDQVLAQNLTPEQIALARMWGEQPDRYARRVVTQLEGLSREKRSLLRFLDETLTEASNKRDEESEEGVEDRYWLLVSLLVGRENWPVLRAALPHQYQQEISWEDMLTFDGMTGPKANAVWAELKAYEAETIASRAEVQRLEEAWKTSTDESERDQLERQSEQIHQQIEQREQQLRLDVLAKLSEQDKEQLAALPPVISLVELVDNLETLEQRVSWTPEQLRWLAPKLEELEELEESSESEGDMMGEESEAEDPEKSGDLTFQVREFQMAKPMALAQIDLAHEAVSKLSRSQLRDFLLGEMP